MDIPFCRKVLEFASAEHESTDYRFDMNHWFQQGMMVVQTHNHQVQTRCETTACLAGTAILLSPDAEVTTSVDYEQIVSINGKRVDGSWSFIKVGAQLMGISECLANWLFMPEYYEYEGDSELNAQALARLAQMIEDAEKTQAEDT